jgi:hypothetical protein
VADADKVRSGRRALFLLTSMVCSLLLLDLAPAHAQPATVDEPPAAPDPERAEQAGRDAGEEQSNQPVVPGIAGEGSPAAGMPAEVGGESQIGRAHV